MTQTTVGIRKLKSHLSSYMKQVKAGTTLIITERGKPVGQIVPIKSSIEEQLQDLAQTGLVEWNGQKLGSTKPMPQIQGEKTVAELLLENRE